MCGTVVSSNCQWSTCSFIYPWNYSKRLKFTEPLHPQFWIPFELYFILVPRCQTCCSMLHLCTCDVPTNPPCDHNTLHFAFVFAANTDMPSLAPSGSCRKISLRLICASFIFQNQSQFDVQRVMKVLQPALQGFSTAHALKLFHI